MKQRKIRNDKNFSAIIFLLFLLSGDLSYAQLNGGVIKIYSGSLHKDNSKSHQSFLNALFGERPPREQLDRDMVCSLEFQCPTGAFPQPVVVIPDQLTYFIRFNNPQQKNVLGKYIIKIYTNDGEEYLLDPNTEGKGAGLKKEHHIYDPYLIYLILGQDINHFEIVSSSGDSKDKYVLDKLEIKDDH